LLTHHQLTKKQAKIIILFEREGIGNAPCTPYRKAGDFWRGKLSNGFKVFIRGIQILNFEQ
jgi:hypothetical protein